MGVKNLWDILESCKKTLPLNHLQNKRVCVDLSCWMVQLHNVNKSHRPMKDKLYLSGLFHRLRALIALNCSIIFVTDGSIPAIKVATYRRRLNSESGVAQDESCSNAATSLRRNMGSEFSCMIKEAKLLGMALGIPCLDGIEEGEAQCALLDSESLCDGCFSSDSDIFLFGAKTVYREICLGEGGYVVCYEMADIERKLGYGRNSLITLAILLGCDYTQGVRGLGAESACQIVKSMGESVVLQQIASDGLAFMKKAKSSRKHGQVLRCNDKENNLDHVVNLNGNKHITQGNSQFLQVIDAYLKPKCHSADSEAVSRVLCTHPFQRTKFQQICSQFFEWSPDKTDEYILPKIAERELRRFANLRATSSELGVHIPLDKMPVKCPISGIIKRRKAHGIECFEVTWEEIHGVKSSIVPADLIVSACPEMIQKFEEMKAEKRKPKQHRPRLKKSEKNKLPMTELDTKLQQLVLDIELETNPAHSSSLLGEATLDNRVTITETDEAKQDPVFDAPSNCEVVNDVPEVISLLTPARPLNRDFLVGARSNIEVDGYASKFCNFRTSQVLEEEVIDLLSPDPSMSECGVSKCHAKNLQCVDVIDLSESETDASPEHARKARELRLFVASIREDIS